MMAYSDRKDHLTAEELVNFLHNEQKVRQSNSQQRMLKPITVLEWEVQSLKNQLS